MNHTCLWKLLYFVPATSTNGLLWLVDGFVYNQCFHLLTYHTITLHAIDRYWSQDVTLSLPSSFTRCWSPVDFQFQVMDVAGNTDRGIRRVLALHRPVSERATLIGQPPLWPTTWHKTISAEHIPGHESHWTVIFAASGTSPHLVRLMLLLQSWVNEYNNKRRQNC